MLDFAKNRQFIDEKTRKNNDSFTSIGGKTIPDRNVKYSAV